jgi:hypothetical protein
LLARWQKAKGLNEFSLEMFKKRTLIDTKPGDCAKKLIRTATEAYFWHERCLIDDRDLKAVARRIPEDNLTPPVGVSEKYREFCLKLWYLRHGLSGIYDQQEEMKKTLAEMKKNGIDGAAAPWEISPEFWRMTPEGYKHISQI